MLLFCIHLLKLFFPGAEHNPLLSCSLLYNLSWKRKRQGGPGDFRVVGKALCCPPIGQVASYPCLSPIIVLLLRGQSPVCR